VKRRLDPAAPAEELFPGCLRITLPDPFVPHVTCAFLLNGPEGPWLLDAGADTEASSAALAAKLEAAGTCRADVRGVLLTHTHLDHAGGLLRWRPPSLAAHARAVAEMRNFEPRSSRGPAALRRMGVPEAELTTLAPHGEPVGGTPFAEIPVAHVLCGSEGAFAPLPGWRWILAEGHAPGHLMLYNQGERGLLVGDQFLARWKTPYQISAPDEDSFGSYLASIDGALALEPKSIFSSHTEVVRPADRWLRERRQELEAHLGRLLDAVAAGACTAYEALDATYQAAPRGGLRVLLLREQLAMLRHLTARGVIRRTMENGVERFST